MRRCSSRSRLEVTMQSGNTDGDTDGDTELFHALYYE